jgi:hypothetical protein
LLQASVERHDCLTKAKKNGPREQHTGQRKGGNGCAWHHTPALAAGAGLGFEASGAEQARFVLGDAFAAKASAAPGTLAHGLTAFMVPAALVERGAVHVEG